ncbi:MAG: sigma-70 family RNA polymerase sigma factor [Bacteroidales bacterium]|jgi:RNA polymerase sigma-70 factor (ECF subfamily)|nr:sigma-70 family RNA polymerase sigma factor [Bacteroidales bacterium]
MEIKPELSDKAQYDLRLVNLAIDGDERAYAELMNRYRDSIYYMLLKMVNNPSDADDLTIEAFGKAFKNIHLYTPNFAFSTWLFRIATNNCIDFIRKKKSAPTAIDQQQDEQDDPAANLQSELPGPEEEMMQKQKIKHLGHVVSQLKPKYRQLIELRFYKEYSYEEIANELNLPLGTVKAQIFRAKELLYNILNKTENI